MDTVDRILSNCNALENIDIDSAINGDLSSYGSAESEAREVLLKATELKTAMAMYRQKRDSGT